MVLRISVLLFMLRYLGYISNQLNYLILLESTETSTPESKQVWILILSVKCHQDTVCCGGTLEVVMQPDSVLPAYLSSFHQAV